MIEFLIGLLKSNKEIIETICSIIGAIGTIAIPVVLWWLNDRKEKAEKEEQLLKDEREFIQKFIDTRLEMPKFSEIDKHSPEENKNFVDNVQIELVGLKSIIEPTKYRYLSNCLYKIISFIKKYNNTDDFPVYYGFVIIGIHKITRYIYIGEEKFNKIWEEEFEITQKLFEKLLEYNKKQSQY